MSKVDLKVVLLGKEFGGKTSLVDRFVNKRFIESKSNNSYQATIGAAFASKKIEINSKVITLGIWDTAGSERYEAMSRMYYRNARAAIICFDLTDDSSFSRAKFWVSELKKNEETCRIYLCGTKCDRIKSDPQLRQVDAQTAINYGNAIGASFTETSSRTGEGVEELFTKIAKDYIEFQMILEGPKNQNFGMSYDNSLNSSNDRRKSYCCF